MLALSLVVIGCPGPDRPVAFALRIAAAGDLAPFRPDAKTSFTSAAVDLAFQPVLRVGEQGQILPGCVRGWERLSVASGRVKVDPDLRFSDGSPVRPEDLIRSLAASGLEARQEGEWLLLESRSSPDPIEITLLYTPLFRDATPAPLGTGPFRLLEADAHHILLERIRPEPGRVARVEIQAVPTPRDAFAKALRGDVNAVTGLDERQSELMEGVPGLRVVRGAGPHAVAVVLNALRFSRAERLGLAAATPIPELVRAYGGYCAPLDTSSHGEVVSPGRALQVATSTHDPGLPRAALALRRALGPWGGDVVAEQTARSGERAAARDFDLMVGTVIAWPPVMLSWFTRTGAGSNWAGYSNPRVDGAIDRGDLPAVLEELRRDPPLVLLCRRERIAAVDARLKNATLGSWGLLETLPDWEVSP